MQGGDDIDGMARKQALDEIRGWAGQALGMRLESKKPKPAQPAAQQSPADGGDDDVRRLLEMAGQ